MKSLTITNKILFVFIFIFFENIIIAQNITINELVASNNTVLADEDGDYSDFIEIYNFGTTTVNLQNFGLTDDESNPFQWVFPNIALQPDKYLLVWASSKNRTYASQPLHTNFKISAGGETITPRCRTIVTHAAPQLPHDCIVWLY